MYWDSWEKWIIIIIGQEKNGLLNDYRIYLLVLIWYLCPQDLSLLMSC